MPPRRCCHRGRAGARSSGRGTGATLDHQLGVAELELQRFGDIREKINVALPDVADQDEAIE